MKILLSCCVSLAALGSALPAFAQAPPAAPQAEPGGERETIVVTAQKRDEDIQDVPISISAFSGDSLEEAGINDIRDLRNITPSLNLATAPQLANTRIEIRGIGTSGNTAIEPSVALFLDDAYVARSAALVSGLNDIRSVEVLRGPQGTLFGRNASMGALLVHTNEPSKKFEGKVSAMYGNYNRTKAEGMLNVPIGDRFAIRGAILGDKRDGFGYNLLTGKDISFYDTFSGRISTAWDITDNLRWVLRADHQHTTGDGIPISTVVAESVTPTFAANWRARLDPDGNGPLVGQTPIITDTYLHTVNQESEGNLDDHTEGLTSNLVWDVGGGWQLKLVNAWRDWNDDQFQVSTGGLPVTVGSRRGYFASESKSHEFQVLSPDTLFGGKANFVAGLYAYEEDFYIGDYRGLNVQQCNIFIRNTTADTPAGTRQRRVDACLAGTALPYSSYTNFWQNTESWAAFFQGTYDITDAWDVTLGVRYTNDEKSGLFDQKSVLPPIPGVTPGTTITSVDSAVTENTVLATDGSKVSYRVGTTYKVNSDVMVFATWSTGYKSGGFDSGRNATVVGQGRIFAPETTENYEAGIKSQWWNGMLTANATLFRTDVSNYQFRTYDGVSFAVRNNGSIRQQGVEWETSFNPIEPLTFNFAGTWLDSEYTDFRGAPNWPGKSPSSVDLTGERVPYSPEWQYTGFLRWKDRLPWLNGWGYSARADFQFVSERQLSATGDNYPLNNESSFTTFGARLGLYNDNGLEITLAGQNINNDTACTSRYVQPNNTNLGLVDTVNGGSVLRCVVTPPPTYTLEVSKSF